MSNCLICYDQIHTSNVFPSCNCSFCPDCLHYWLSLKIHDFSYRSTEKIKCPNEFCNAKYLIDPEFLLKCQFSKEQKDSLEHIIFLKYLQNADDVVECPNLGCSYYGFTGPESNCKEKYQCESCNYCWKEESLLPDRIFEKINRVLTGKVVGEALTYVHRELFTENCPNCLINISRNGGCYHMTCKNCNYQFCWYCKQKYEGHKLTICMMHLSVKFFINLVVIFWVLGKFGMNKIIWDFATASIFFIGKYLIFYNLILMVFLLYAIYVYQYIQLRNDIKRRKSEAGVLFIGSIALAILIFLIRKGYLLDCLMSWGVEAVAGGVIYNLVWVFTLIFNNWLTNVE